MTPFDLPPKKIVRGGRANPCAPSTWPSSSLAWKGSSAWPGCVGNILCEAHNSPLSPFDTAGKDMFVAMDALNNAAGDPAAPHQTLSVDGGGLERWMLKSLCGGMYCGAFRVTESGTMKGECPPIEFLQILFEGVPFPARQGLYWMPPNPER